MALSQKSAVLSLWGESRVRTFAAGVVLLTLAFGVFLYDWVRLALAVDLHSHVILMPLISGYLIWRRRSDLPRPGPGVLGVSALFGGVALILVGTAWRWRDALQQQDGVAMMTGAYLAGLLAVAAACLGGDVLKAVAFPVFLLIFAVPMPSGVETALEHLLQWLSAEAANGLFWLGGETFLRDGQVFRFPHLTIRVAQECSGIRSSYVLFIVSLVAANGLLRSPWRRALLVAAVLPLGVLRNAFRVYTITALTLHVNPGIIDSPLHHRGGPLFFVLSLIPFTVLLWILVRAERPNTRRPLPSC